MKKIKLLTILIMCIIIVTGCSKSKKEITASDFYNTAKDQGYLLGDVSSLYGLANKAYQTNKDSEISILFIEGKNETDMFNMLIDEAKNVYSKAGIQDEYPTAEAGQTTTKTPKKNVDKGKNYQSVEVTTNDRYYYLVYVGKTFFEIEGDISKKEDINKLIDTMKY